MKTQVMRCPNCGKLYNAEDGACPNCHQPMDALQAVSREDAGLFTRLLRIFGIFILVPPLISLSAAYFALGLPAIQEHLSFLPLLALIVIPWLGPVIFTLFLARQKGKSSLWFMLLLFIPILAVVIIPYLWMKEPRDVDGRILLLYALAFPLMFISLLGSVAVWMG